MGTLELHISAVGDGATFIVTIEQPATGRRQVIAGVVADSEQEAIERVCGVLERNAKRALGASAYITRGPLISE